MWDPVPQPGIKPRAPALGAWSLSHWTTREVHFSCISNPSPSGKRWSVILTRNVRTLGFADFLTSILCIIWLLILLTCPNHAQTISMLTEQMRVWSLIQVADQTLWGCKQYFLLLKGRLKRVSYILKLKWETGMLAWDQVSWSLIPALCCAVLCCLGITDVFSRKIGIVLFNLHTQIHIWELHFHTGLALNFMHFIYTLLIMSRLRKYMGICFSAVTQSDNHVENFSGNVKLYIHNVRGGRKR